MHARRRTVLAAGTAALVTGCGSSGDGGGGGDESSAPPAGDGELARTSDIPVGGGAIFKDRKIVVTQPEAGEFKAFSAVCTHAGCIVSTVADGTIDCACHGSRFAVEDGAVERGPATKPLPAERITVAGGGIRLG
ncbi:MULTISPECIES: Rieske (2Fe-2S) protein [Streptomyces]|uniref:Cytochrome bc1 complex Rieske iron-sulfur subunit n=1 Tax=Streptomyces glycanivorans TaxID=3033808 RepID=A0ABY9JL13_9ACTN|nr:MULTISPECIES: Rieske (2Fe-2S) protein [unclassified Streptomyces]WSQ80802.1 Rieske (2Fe-2S) protein [Streptomyces sp. NBC_01213]TXS10142.1 Rieske (2Fe-2S) protein [Streptomyces sp. wa22]WLQ67376.1 Rieske (2Fe-2S) protein [Streptomyces sp. Alt3]WSQ88132.1 Rieske (2Fe-2S) protein [Streptomyces sp. NBC_01212]WSR05860.1 Rieske (2Fe-2S) protein [Streptomyces sp. NBC_01208]